MIDQRLQQLLNDDDAGDGIAGNTQDDLASLAAQDGRLAGLHGDAVIQHFTQLPDDPGREVLPSGGRTGIEDHQIALADVQQLPKEENEEESENNAPLYSEAEMVADKIKEHRPFEGANVYVSSFNGFTGAQLNALRQIIAQADHVEISLDICEGDLGNIGGSKLGETVRKLKFCT